MINLIKICCVIAKQRNSFYISFYIVYRSVISRYGKWQRFFFVPNRKEKNQSTTYICFRWSKVNHAIPDIRDLIWVHLLNNLSTEVAMINLALEIDVIANKALEHSTYMVRATAWNVTCTKSLISLNYYIYSKSSLTWSRRDLASNNNSRTSFLTEDIRTFIINNYSIILFTASFQSAKTYAGTEIVHGLKILRIAGSNINDNYKFMTNDNQLCVVLFDN